MEQWSIGLVCILAAAGCGANYSGEYARGITPQSRAMGLDCLDVRITRRASHDVRLVYEIGNRCLGPVEVDLSAVRVSAGTGTSMAPLYAKDRRRELRPARLDGRGSLTEVIAYASSDRIPPRVCVVLDGLTDGAPGEPVCLDEGGL